VQEPLKEYRVSLREVASAGEPMKPEVIERVQAAWGLTIRDGFGQTETTALIGNPPGQAVKPGSMGKGLPGYRIVLVSADGTRGDEGEICVETANHPVGLMSGYAARGATTLNSIPGPLYHTGE
jgi:acetyl-CoA synthetase